MKTKILLLVVITSIIFTACKKDEEDTQTTPSETTNNPDIDNRILGKWKQTKWYFDPEYTAVEQFNTIQTWEFLNTGKVIRTYEYPNNPEYNTFINNNDVWQMYAEDNYLSVKTDSLFCVTNNGYFQGGNFVEYNIEKLNDDTLIIVSLDSYYYNETFIFISDN